MPGFPDKFMPYLNMPAGAELSTAAIQVYGRTVRALRREKFLAIGRTLG